MSLVQREQAIREERKIEAINKDFMGPAGKIGVIARYLGHPIVYQGTRFASNRSIEDLTGECFYPYAEDDVDEIPVIEEDVLIETIGYIFDGLKQAMHIEIKYLNESHSLSVYYKGYMVYMEVAGDLHAYAPFPEWENLIDTLYQQSEKRFKRQKEKEKERIQEESVQKRNDFLHRLRTLWGL